MGFSLKISNKIWLGAIAAISAFALIGCPGNENGDDEASPRTQRSGRPATTETTKASPKRFARQTDPSAENRLLQSSMFSNESSQTSATLESTTSTSTVTSTTITATTTTTSTTTTTTTTSITTTSILSIPTTSGKISSNTCQQLAKKPILKNAIIDYLSSSIDPNSQIGAMAREHGLFDVDISLFEAVVPKRVAYSDISIVCEGLFTVTYQFNPTYDQDGEIQLLQLPAYQNLCYSSRIANQRELFNYYLTEECE